jgi:hypothetical protein
LPHNRINGGSGPGIEVTSNSNDNFLSGNRMSGNTPAVVDDGTNNCWRHNVYTTGSVPPAEIARPPVGRLTSRSRPRG